MASTAGSIVVDLLMRTGSFGTDTKRAEKYLKDLQKTAMQAGAAIGAAAVAAGAALAVFVKQTVDSMDALTDMSQMAGVSIERLSALTYAAQLNNVAQDQLVDALGRLSKNLSDAAAGTGEARKGLAALGINVKDLDGNLKASDVALVEIAAKFAEMQDGAGKTALAINLFGKSGAALIPLLNAGADGIADLEREAAKLGVTIDSKTANAAADLNDNLDRMKAGWQGVINQLTVALLPLLTALANKMVELSTNSQTFKSLVDGLAFSLKALASGGIIIAAVFNSVAEAIASVAAYVGQLAQGNLRTAGDSLIIGGKNMVASLKEANQLLQDIWNPQSRGSSSGGPGGRAPLIPGEGALQELKARVAAEVDAINKEAARLASQFENMERILDASRQYGWTQDKEYFERRKKLLEDATTIQLGAIDKELAALKSARDSAALDAKDRIDLDKQIQAATEKRAQAVAKAGTDQLLLQMAEKHSTDQLRLSIEQMSKSYEDLAQKQQDQYDRGLAAFGRGDSFQEYTRRQDEILDDIQDRRDRLEEQRRANQIAPEKYAAELAALATYKARALSQWDDYYTRQKAQERDWTNGFTRAFENYMDDAANVAHQADLMFTSAFKNMEDALVAFVQTGKLDFKSLVNSIIADLIRLQIRAATSGIFKELGGLGGLGGIIGSLTGGLSGSSAASLANAVGGEDPLGTMIGAMGLTGARASGGPVMSGGRYLVGERGPELFVPNTAGAIVPNNALGGGAPNITIYNQGTPQQYDVQSWSRSDIALIARDEVFRSGPRMVEGQLSSPNSRGGKALSNNTTAGWRRR